MNARVQDDGDAVTLAPADAPAGASVIFMHGLGADGNDFLPVTPMLQRTVSLAVRFVFPHAPVRPVTINNGYRMRAWYDISGLSPREAEDAAGIRDAAIRVGRYVARERDAGIPAARIILAGFSQGGAVALHFALRHEEPLAGVLALSTYLPLRDTLATEAAEANRRTPIFMCHGTDDPVLPIALGELSRDVLRAQGYAVVWKSYPMQHEVCMPELADIGAWLRVRLAADR